MFVLQTEVALSLGNEKEERKRKEEENRKSGVHDPKNPVTPSNTPPGAGKLEIPSPL